MPGKAKPRDVDWERLKVAPWERLPGESDRLWAQFQHYRDRGPLARTQEDTAAWAGVTRFAVNETSMKWHWRTRVEAYDRYMDAVSLKQQQEALREMNDRQARIALAMFTLIGRRLVGDEVAGVDALDPNKLTPLEIARLSEVATKIERLARDAETERVNVHTREELSVNVGFHFEPDYVSPASETIDAFAKRADTPQARKALESGLAPADPPPDGKEAEDE